MPFLCASPNLNLPHTKEETTERNCVFAGGCEARTYAAPHHYSLLFGMRACDCNSRQAGAQPQTRECIGAAGQSPRLTSGGEAEMNGTPSALSPQLSAPSTLP